MLVFLVGVGVGVGPRGDAAADAGDGWVVMPAVSAQAFSRRRLAS
ncbi:hypothetical protein ABIA38_007153 [Embleya sp. AB8]